MKRAVSLLLCLAMLLSMTACSQEKPAAETAVPAEAVVTVPGETESPVESALMLAQSYLDAEDYDSALVALEQLPSDTNDPRVAAMLESLRPVDLAVEYNTLISDPDFDYLPDLGEDVVQIHSVTVQEMPSGKVRFTVEYTTQKNLQIFLIVGGLTHDANIRTNKKASTLCFEVDAEDLKTLRGAVEVKFARDEFTFFLLTIYSAWEGVDLSSLRQEAVEVPFTVSGNLPGASLTLHSVSIQSLDKEHLICIVDYTGSSPGMYLETDLPGKEGTYTENSKRLQFCFITDRETLTTRDSFRIHGAVTDRSEFTWFADVHLAECDIPEYPYPEAPDSFGEPVSLEYYNDNKIGDMQLEIHSVTAQVLTSGFIRYAVEATSTADVGWGSFGFINNSIKTFGGGGCSGERETLYVYIPKEDNAQLPEFLMKFGDEKNYYTLHAPTTISDSPLDIQVLKDDSPDLLVQLAAEAEQLIHIPVIDSEAAIAVDTSMVTPLTVTRKLSSIRGQSGINPYGEYHSQAFPENADLTGNPALAYSLTFSDETKFPDTMPASFDPEALLEWGKDPGLNVDVLHKLGYTGKGAVIAYVDQPIPTHEAYANVNLHNTNNANTNTSMHGPAVLSLLAGKDIGTAPEAEVYFYGQAAWDGDQTTHAECLYQIIEQNKILPEGEKITMVGFSDNIDPTEKNAQAFRDAVTACEEAGIMVWFCAEYGAAAFLPLSDKDNYNNVVREHWFHGAADLVFVPAASRTTATSEDKKYIYWGEGGLSWTMPYVLGLYAIVTEIAPSLTQDDLRQLIVETAYPKDGMRIVNPVEFVAAALEGVGKTEEAKELRDAVNASKKYTYAVMNKSAMTAEDIASAENYLKEITDSQVLVVDSSNITSAQKLYTILQADHIQRGGTVMGVQIFGDSALVPSFQIGYKVQMETAVDDAGTMLTDLFYGNFNNAAENLSQSYNVLDHFAKDLPVQLVPEWKVARLSLGKGEFTAFLEKYMTFAETAGLGQHTLTNFSNPIFASSIHMDDMGYFLNRLEPDFGIDLVQYRLYGNQLGQYPVNTEVLGGFTAENLTLENEQGVREFIINTHGQKNNVDKCWFENGQEKRESLMNSQNINTVLSANPYYLDMWTCNNGEGMKNNITTAALKGSCVGMFSNTHLISNNGVNNRVSPEEMTESNFYWFYLNYLKALSEGDTRSDAFFAAQKAYGNALMVDSQNGIRGEANYQFNLYNLLGYHNFGLIEPSRAWQCLETGK